jgi:hypothetical protein
MIELTAVNAVRLRGVPEDATSSNCRHDAKPQDVHGSPSALRFASFLWASLPRRRHRHTLTDSVGKYLTGATGYQPLVRARSVRRRRRSRRAYDP